METFHSLAVALSFNALDILTGFVAAVRNRDIKSGKLRDGLFKKTGFVLCYFVAWLMDTHGSAIGLSLGVDVLPVVVLYACTTELVSVLENITIINPDILPEKLMELFHVSSIGKGGDQ